MRRSGEPGGSGPFFLGVEVEEVEEAGEEKYTFDDPRGIRSSSPSLTRVDLREGARDSFRGEDFLEGGRGRGMTLWLDANNGVRLRSLLFGVTQPVASMLSTSSKPSVAPRGLTAAPGRTLTEVEGTSNTPDRLLGVEVTACENDGGFNAYRVPGFESCARLDPDTRGNLPAWAYLASV